MLPAVWENSIALGDRWEVESNHRRAKRYRIPANKILVKSQWCQ
jgi:hypothetical protein